MNLPSGDTGEQLVIFMQASHKAETSFIRLTAPSSFTGALLQPNSPCEGMALPATGASLAPTRPAGASQCPQSDAWCRVSEDGALTIDVSTEFANRNIYLEHRIERYNNDLNKVRAPHYQHQTETHTSRIAPQSRHRKILLHHDSQRHRRQQSHARGCSATWIRTLTALLR